MCPGGQAGLCLRSLHLPVPPRLGPAPWALGPPGAGPRGHGSAFAGLWVPLALSPHPSPIPVTQGLSVSWVETLVLAVTAANLLLLPEPPSLSSEIALVAVGTIPTNEKIRWEDAPRGGSSGVDGSERAPPGGGRCTWRGTGQWKQGCWPGHLLCRGVTSWPPGSGVCRILLRSQGAVSPAGQEPSCPRKHLEVLMRLQPGPSRYKSVEPNQVHGTRPTGGRSLESGRQLRCLYHLSSFHHKVTLKFRLCLIHGRVTGTA